MKTIIGTILVTLMVSFTAYAGEWIKDFATEYVTSGIYPAVELAMEQGAIPEDIMYNAFLMTDVNPLQLVAALYCAQANPEDIRQSALNFDLSEMLLVAGYEQAKTVCGDELNDVQAYTPISPSFVGVPSGNDNGGTYGSPSTF